MNLISATQLELLIPRLPNALETPVLWWDLRQSYDQAYLESQTDDLGLSGFEVRFHNTRYGWGLIVHGNMILVEYIENMLLDLQEPHEVNADSCNLAVPNPPEFELASLYMPLDQRLLRWEKALFSDAWGKPSIEWAIPIN